MLNHSKSNWYVSIFHTKFFYENDIHRDLVSVGAVGAAASIDFDNADLATKVYEKS